jgi:lysyl oxidase
MSAGAAPPLLGGRSGARCAESDHSVNIAGGIRSRGTVAASRVDLPRHDPRVIVRRRVGALALAISLAALLVGPAYVARAGTVTSYLPDLAMVPPFEFHIVRTSDGRRLLRFSTIVVNIGVGQFRLIGYDADGAKIGDTLSVQQLIRQSDGSFRVRATTAKMQWASDGHNHWHVIGYQQFRLVDLNARIVGRVAKTGFCSLDSYNYRSTKPSYFDAAHGVCQVGPDGRVLMGTKRGWGDIYPWDIAFQWIDITGLPAGDYRLDVIADPPLATGGRFLESNEKNNRGWAKIRIKGTTVTVLSKSAMP